MTDDDDHDNDDASSGQLPIYSIAPRKPTHYYSIISSIIVWLFGCRRCLVFYKKSFLRPSVLKMWHFSETRVFRIFHGIPIAYRLFSCSHVCYVRIHR